VAYIFPEHERGSIAAKLSQLFTLPAKTFDIPVEPGRTIKIQLHLLNDQENLEVANMVDKYGPLARIIIERREILARAIDWIEGEPIRMPEAVRQDYNDRLSRPPTQTEEKLWVFEMCQPVILDALLLGYDELATEQRVLVSELKKNFEGKLDETSPEMKSSQ